MPEGPILAVFGVLGGPWAQVGAKGVLEKVLGCILGGFWQANFFDIFGWEFLIKKAQRSNQVFNGFWVIFGSILDCVF